MSEDYRAHQERNRAYAKTESGKAARARSHAKYSAKRKAMKDTPPSVDAKPLAEVLQTWGKT